MGIDFDSKLIVGFKLEDDKVKKWMEINGINDTHKSNELFIELYPRLSKIPKEYPSLYIVSTSNTLQSDNEEKHFLSFFCEPTTIGKIKLITPELLVIANTIYKDIMGSKLDITSIDDIKVFSESYVW